MQRYNVFYQVHKGLKALLYETALQLQHADFWNIQEADAAIATIEEVVRLFDKHAHSEDNHIFPAVEKYEPSVADVFEKEHVKDHELGEQLTAAIGAYQEAAIITSKAKFCMAIHAAYLKFMVFNIEHMLKEEEVLNPILWRHYTDAELHQLTQQIIASIPPDYMARYSKWMLRGLNNAEISNWLREAEQHAPEPVFQSLFATAEKELSGIRFRQVLEGMTNGAMLA